MVLYFFPIFLFHKHYDGSSCFFQSQPPSVRLSSSLILPRGPPYIAMTSPLRLARHASCCCIHVVAMVSAGAVLQCSLAPSVLGVSWVENAVIPLIFSPGDGIHPAAIPQSMHWHRSTQFPSQVQTHAAQPAKEDCCFGLVILRQFESK